MIKGDKEELKQPMLEFIKLLREEVKEQFGDLVDKYSKKVADGVDKKMMFYLEERGSGYEIMLSDDLERLSNLPMFSFKKQFEEVKVAIEEHLEENEIGYKKIEFT